VTILLVLGIGFLLMSRFAPRKDSTVSAEFLDPGTNARVHDIPVAFSVPTERLWLDMPPESISAIRLDSVLHSPRDVLYQNGTLIVSDYPVRIFRFDTSGVYLNRFGSGQGFAPGQLPDYSDVFEHDGAVVVVSPNGRKLVRFSAEGRVRETAELDFLALYGIPWGDSLLVSALTMSRALPLQVLAKDGTYGTAFGEEITRFGSGLDIIGRLTSGTDGRIFYLFKYESTLLEFSPQGSVTNMIVLSDRQKLESARIEKDANGNATSRAPNPPVTYMDIEFEDGRLYISGLDKRTRPYVAFIDVFSVDPWSYLGSIEMSRTVIGLTADGTTLYAATDTSIVRIEVPIPVDGF